MALFPTISKLLLGIQHLSADGFTTADIAMTLQSKIVHAADKYYGVIDGITQPIQRRGTVTLTPPFTSVPVKIGIRQQNGA